MAGGGGSTAVGDAGTEGQCKHDRGLAGCRRQVERYHHTRVDPKPTTQDVCMRDTYIEIATRNA